MFESRTAVFTLTTIWLATCVGKAAPLHVELISWDCGTQRLHVGGSPDFIEGAGEFGPASDLKRLHQGGANSMRVWSVDQADEGSEEANASGSNFTFYVTAPVQ